MPGWLTLAEHKCRHLTTPECSNHLFAGDELCTKAKEYGNSSEVRPTVRQPNRSSLKANEDSFQTAGWAASVSGYVCVISAVQTLEQTHGKCKVNTTCLGG